ncbi:porin [Pseudoduganella sp. RAF53_2]|uniref:porin n=1 Tax=unclassified Pseudoduganella TaxID=2637179 RepID=UPI003F9DA168
MKRFTLGLLTLAPLAGLVHADPSVSIFGDVDGGVRYQTNASADGGSKISMSSNGYYNSNKLDFAGSDDLGGGFKADFLLESGFNLGTGQLDNTTNTLFQRQAFVRVKTPYGALSLGRQYTISHDFIYVFDPFGFRFTPLIPLTKASSGTRFDNDLKYVVDAGPVKLEVEDSLGEQAGSTARKAARGVGLIYNNGALAFGASYNHRSVPVGAFYNGDIYYLVGAAYNVDKLKISGGYMQETVKSQTGVDSKTRNMFGGVSYRFKPQASFTVGYYVTTAPDDPARRRGMTVAEIDYSLSKRTVLYAELDYTRFSKAAVGTLNTVGVPNQTGATFGINHRF